MLLTTACLVAGGLVTWALLDFSLAKLSAFLPTPSEFAPVPRRPPKRVAVVRSTDAAADLSALDAHGCVVTEFEALVQNPIKMTWAVLETLPCVVVLQQHVTDALGYGQVLRDAGYNGVVFLHVAPLNATRLAHRLVWQSAIRGGQRL